MTNLYRVKDSNLVSVARQRLANEDQLQRWIAADPKLIGLDVLVLGREVRTDSGARIDVLALESDGTLVIIECKRDRTSRDIIGQVLDYGSWISKLTTRHVHEIAQANLGKLLQQAFKDHFDIPLPENLNESHKLLIVASEFDPSSRRIVEYLAETHDSRHQHRIFQYLRARRANISHYRLVARSGRSDRTCRA